MQSLLRRGMKIAIQGCGHGDLNSIYSTLSKLEAESGSRADLLIVCGDFQAIRHARDLDTLACPPKYRRMGDFQEYWQGKRKAPVLTLFIGGNHEASTHLWDLYYGGWVAPKIYFMGFSGVVRFGGLRIAGISGLHDPRHEALGYYERPPLDEHSMRSIYHTRTLEYHKLSLLNGVDMFISHEWPHRIYEHGDLAGLLRCKPYFKNDIKGSGIGAPPLARLMEQLRPTRWFAAHMHVEFTATVEHPTGQKTEFLALDKCLPGRRHMRLIDVPTEGGALNLEYDQEWLAIVRAMHPYLSLTRDSPKIPNNIDLTEHLQFTSQITNLKIPTKYEKAADRPGRRTTLLQTFEFCKMLRLEDHWGLPHNIRHTDNPEEIRLDHPLEGTVKMTR